MNMYSKKTLNISINSESWDGWITRVIPHVQTNPQEKSGRLQDVILLVVEWFSPTGELLHSQVNKFSSLKPQLIHNLSKFYLFSVLFYRNSICLEFKKKQSHILRDNNGHLCWLSTWDGQFPGLMSGEWHKVYIQVGYCQSQLWQAWGQSPLGQPETSD